MATAPIWICAQNFRCAKVKLVMNDDTAATDHRSWIVTIWRVELIIVDQTVGVAPDPHAELILTTTTGLIAVDGRQHEAIIAPAVDRSKALVLRLPAA